MPAPIVKGFAYRVRWAEKDDVESIRKVMNEGAAGLGGPVHTSAILGYISPSRMCLVLEGAKGIVGALTARFPTKGVCYNTLLSLSKSVRGQGLGGALLCANIRFLGADRVDGDQPNPMQCHKWFAVYPTYNVEVHKLYDAMKWEKEGTLHMHTKNKTDLIIRAWYPLEMTPPKFWHEMTKGAPPVEWRGLLRLPKRMESDMFDNSPVVDQGKDGELW